MSHSLKSSSMAATVEAPKRKYPNSFEMKINLICQKHTDLQPSLTQGMSQDTHQSGMVQKMVLNFK